MARVLSFLLSPLYFTAFGLLLALFDPPMRLAWLTFGVRGQQAVVEALNGLLLVSLWIMGVRTQWRQEGSLPADRPLIVVSNHQSMHDIPPYIWYLRQHHAKFVSKRSLARGIPSVSFNLRVGGSALVDRSNREQAVTAIAALGARISATNGAAVLFPEGTRSRDGRPKTWKSAGFLTLLQAAPRAVVVPVTIQGTGELQTGWFPVRFGTEVVFTVHPAIDPTGRPPLEVFAEAERTVNAMLPPPASPP
jgi:1-acyl-sn-glycerol-3-phosphate acyltransferase